MAECADCRLPIEVDGPRAGVRTPRCYACASRATDEIRFTPLRKDDLELVLAWRSNPCVYRHFRRQNGPIEWRDHVEWFESRDPTRHDFIIRYRGRRVGVISLDADDEVSIFIGEVAARGEGTATESLCWLQERFKSRAPLFAEVHDANEPSIGLFESCEFEENGREGEWLRFVYDPT